MNERLALLKFENTYASSPIHGVNKTAQAQLRLRDEFLVNPVPDSINGVLAMLEK